MSVSRSKQLLVEAARLYYVEGLSQEQIGREMAMTRSNVSRVLRAARETGVVEVRIHDFDGRNERLEEALTRRFRLRAAVVAASDPLVAPQDKVVRLASTVFLDAMSTARIAAVSWGTTLQAVVAGLPQARFPGTEIVQLVGGLISFDAQGTAHDVVRDLGDRLSARYRYLNTPAVFDSAETLRQLLGETSIRDTLDTARRADFALVGIGNPNNGSSATLIRLLNLEESEQAQLWAEQPAGDVCGRFYKIDGSPVSHPSLRNRILAINLEDLRNIPVVIGVAWGADKGAAAHGALCGGFINVFVCDTELARAVLETDTHPVDAKAGITEQEIGAGVHGLVRRDPNFEHAHPAETPVPSKGAAAELDRPQKRDEGRPTMIGR